jgi:hypothetical protein
MTSCPVAAAQDDVVRDLLRRDELHLPGIGDGLEFAAREKAGLSGVHKGLQNLGLAV